MIPMLDPLQDLIQSLARVRDPAHVPDQAQVHARLAQYLRERGRRVADGLDLGQVPDHELEELGRFDVLGQMPTVDQALAPHLAMFTDRRQPGMAQAQHELDHSINVGRRIHDHGRLRETGVDLDQDHTRLQLLGLDPTAGHDQDQANGQAQDPRPRSVTTAPELSEHPRPGPESPRAGRVGVARSPEKPRDKRPKPDDEVKWYLENVQDPDDKEWRPT
jgi:hypothetical protein